MKLLTHAMIASMLVFLVGARNAQADFLGLAPGDWDVTLFDCPFTGGVTCPGLLHIEDHPLVEFGTDWDFDFPNLGLHFTDPGCLHLFNDNCIQNIGNLQLYMQFDPGVGNARYWELVDFAQVPPSRLVHGEWDAQVHGTVPGVPEPSALVLMMTGVGVIRLRGHLLKRRRRA